MQFSAHHSNRLTSKQDTIPMYKKLQTFSLSTMQQNLHSSTTAGISGKNGIEFIGDDCFPARCPYPLSQGTPVWTLQSQTKDSLALVVLFEELLPSARTSHGTHKPSFLVAPCRCHVCLSVQFSVAGLPPSPNVISGQLRQF